MRAFLFSPPITDLQVSFLFNFVSCTCFSRFLILFVSEKVLEKEIVFVLGVSNLVVCWDCVWRRRRFVFVSFFFSACYWWRNSLGFCLVPEKVWKREGKEMSLLLFRTVMFSWDVKAFFSCTCSVAEQLGVLFGC